MRKSFSFWQHHVATLEEQSISVAQYARDNNINVRNLYNWRSKLKNKNTITSNSTKRSSSSALNVERKTSRFVAMQIEQDIVSVNQNACTLKLSPTILLELNNLPDPKWLADIINLSKAV